MEVKIILPANNAAVKSSVTLEKAVPDIQCGADTLLETIADAFERDKNRSLSDDIIWSKRRKFRNGKFSLGYSRMLGFKKPDERGGNPEIDEDGAKIVRRIFAMFLEGGNYKQIARALTDDGIPTPSGVSDTWSAATIKSILQNEKYSGNALLQKTFVDSYLTKKTLPNVGQLPQYWFEGSHGAIIEMPVFELVQSEIRRRSELGSRLKSNSLLSCRIKCGVCGEYYTAKTWHKTSADSHTVWKCNKKYENAKPCDTPVVTEDEVKSAFITAYSRLISDRERLLAEIYSNIEHLSENTLFLDVKLSAARDQATKLHTGLQELVRQNAKSAQNQDNYSVKFQTLRDCQAETQLALESLGLERSEQIAQKERLSRFAMWLEQSDAPLTGLELVLWYAVLDAIIANENNSLTFLFKNGAEINIDRH